MLRSRWENRERRISIQMNPLQSIVKTAQPPLTNYSSNISGTSSPTSGDNSGKTVLTLRRVASGDGWGRFAMIPSHLPNREDGITDLRAHPAITLRLT